MRPMQARSQLVVLTLANFALLVAAARLLPVEGPWILAAALVLQIFLAVALARRIARSAEAFGLIARALMSGAKAPAPDTVRIAELASAAEQLASAANAVSTREAALRAAERAKDDFLAILAHELRTPLGALASAAHVVRNAPASEAAQISSEVIARQVEHMTRLIEDLLDLSRVARGKVSLSRQPINLAAAVEKAVDELRHAGRLARHEVRLDLSEAWSRADEARIQQIVSNLVGNAVRYAPEGGAIGITLRRERDTAVLRVRDNGIGMSPEVAGRVFDLFVQGDDSGRRGAGGLGIGLALVRHLAELHGGKAYAASNGPGQGSIFTVSLPVTEARAEAGAPAVAAPRSRHSIVLVEDNADTREAMVAALQLGGHDVYPAADGNAGVRKVAEVKPDVAVIDISLPGIDGYQVAHTLRHDPQHRDTVLVAISGREHPDSLRRAREAGFDEYLTKPIPPDRLVRLIDAAARNKKARSSAEAGPF